MKWIRFVAPLFMLALQSAFAYAQTPWAATGTVTPEHPAPLIYIKLAHGAESEKQTREQLNRLLSSYDVSKWIYTHDVIIDEKAIPHSHPVLTLHTRHLRQDLELLSTFVHEQFHWFENNRQADLAAAISELKKRYPKVPAGYPDGADSEQSTYLHLVVCYLEYAAMDQLVGPGKATATMTFWAGDHYRWVYKTLLSDRQAIGEIVTTHHLLPADLR